jgi:hypothetical protein
MGFVAGYNQALADNNVNATMFLPDWLIMVFSCLVQILKSSIILLFPSSRYDIPPPKCTIHLHTERYDVNQLVSFMPTMSRGHVCH